MKQFPSRFRRLDGALADLPVEQPMLLTELDGFLAGLLLCPELVARYEWMTVVWGAETEGVPPFEDPLDVEWFANAVTARQNEIARDLSREKLQPIFDVDERNGELLWESWMDGFAEAVALRPAAWEALAGYAESAPHWSRLSTFIAVARNESDLDSVEINALEEQAPAELTHAVQGLYAARRWLAGAASAAEPAPTPAKVGRNDPCQCGSGKKHKRCCG